MSADPTLDDNENGSDEGSRSSPSLLAAGPPRPPRPAKRTSSPRIPMPMPMHTPPESAANDSIDRFDEFDAAPPRQAGRDDDIPSAPPGVVRARSAGAMPQLSEPSSSYDDGDPHAPPAPLTPWRDVPPLVTRVVEADSSPPVGIDEMDEREDTIVGEVPKNLLEMSTSNDDNTRAYTAPQELIELAKRKREERMQEKRQARIESAAPPVPDPSSIVTERPPAMKRRDEALRQADSVRGAMLHVDSLTPRSNGESAPPVHRPVSGADSARENGVRTQPPKSSEPLLELGPVSSLDGADFQAAPASNESAPPREVAPESAVSLSSYKTPWFTPARRWLSIAIAFIVLGYFLARSNRLLDLILH